MVPQGKITVRQVARWVLLAIVVLASMVLALGNSLFW